MPWDFDKDRSSQGVYLYRQSNCVLYIALYAHVAACIHAKLGSVFAT
jgi:hypothetical protein